MNVYLRCETIYKFPPLNTWTEKLFGYAFVYAEREKTMLSKIQSWTSSFTAKEFSLYARDVSVEKKEEILNLWVEGSIVVASIVDNIKYMAVISIVNRVAELGFLSLQSQINQSTKLGSREKFALNIIMNIMPCVIMWFLGYKCYEFFVYKALTVIFYKIVPYKISNFVREMDFLSNDKNLHARDFIVRNTLIFIRNFFVTRIAFDVVGMYFWYGIFMKAILTDAAKIQFCSPDRSIVNCVSNDSVRELNYWMVELGWMAGKMFFDLTSIYVLKKMLKVEDLRDPLYSLLSVKARKWIGSYSQRERLAEAIKRKIENKLEEQANQSKKSQPRPRQDLFSIEYAEPGYNTYVDFDTTRKKIKKGKRTKKGETVEETPKTTATERKKDFDFFKHTVEAQDFQFVRLSGDDHNKNIATWGVILEDNVDFNHFNRYFTSLKSGSMHKGGAIQWLTGNIYEIRPTKKDRRLLGSSYKGNECYSALQNYMPLEDAWVVIRKMENDAPDEVRLIIFGEAAEKHNKINRVKNKIKRKNKRI